MCANVLLQYVPLAAGPGELLIGMNWQNASRKEPIRGSLAHFRPRRGFELNKCMIKQMSH